MILAVPNNRATNGLTSESQLSSRYKEEATLLFSVGNFVVKYPPLGL